MSASQPRLEDLRIHREKKPADPRRSAPIILGIVGLAIVAAIVWWLARPKAPEVRTVAAREVATAGPGVARTVLNASGYVTARREATVSSKVTGKVLEVLVEEGLRVTEGQVLARLDDANTRASLQLAHASTLR